MFYLNVHVRFKMTAFPQTSLRDARKLFSLQSWPFYLCLQTGRPGKSRLKTQGLCLVGCILGLSFHRNEMEFLHEYLLLPDLFG